jgi:hypothetical protein
MPLDLEVARKLVIPIRRPDKTRRKGCRCDLVRRTANQSGQGFRAPGRSRILKYPSLAERYSQISTVMSSVCIMGCGTACYPSAFRARGPLSAPKRTRRRRSAGAESCTSGRPFPKSRSKKLLSRKNRM